MKRILLGIIIFSCFPWQKALTQEDVSDSLNIDSSSLEIGANYDSNYNYYGIFNNFKVQPSLLPSLSYYGKRGLFLYSSYQFLFNSPSGSKSYSTETDLLAGWNFNLFDEAVTISPSYCHFFYSSGNQSGKTIYSQQTELAISGIFNWFRPSLNTDYLFGQRSAFNFNLVTGTNFHWSNILTKEASLDFSPAIGTNYGQLSHYPVVDHMLSTQLSPARVQYGDNITIRTLEANGTIVKNRAFDKILANIDPDATLGQIFTPPPKNFHFNSVDLFLPVTYSLKNITFTSGLDFSEPLSVPNFIKTKAIIYFSGGISYSFNL